MTGEHLLWLQSYMNLSDLMQYVSINGGTSVKYPLRCVSLRLKKNRLKKPFVITFRLILILSVLRFSLAL